MLQQQQLALCATSILSPQIHNRLADLEGRSCPPEEVTGDPVTLPK